VSIALCVLAHCQYVTKHFLRLRDLAIVSKTSCQIARGIEPLVVFLFPHTHELPPPVRQRFVYFARKQLLAF
jgi:hypothetical protein